MFRQLKVPHTGTQHMVYEALPSTTVQKHKERTNNPRPQVVPAGSAGGRSVVPVLGDNLSSFLHISFACSSLHLRMGLPPPISVYAFSIIGVRLRAISGPSQL